MAINSANKQKKDADEKQYADFKTTGAEVMQDQKLYQDQVSFFMAQTCVSGV